MLKTSSAKLLVFRSTSVIKALPSTCPSALLLGLFLLLIKSETFLSATAVSLWFPAALLCCLLKFLLTRLLVLTLDS